MGNNDFGMENLNRIQNEKFVKLIKRDVDSIRSRTFGQSVTKTFIYEIGDFKFNLKFYSFYFNCKKRKTHLMAFDQSFGASDVIGQFFGCNKSHHRADPCH